MEEILKSKNIVFLLAAFGGMAGLFSLVKLLPDMIWKVIKRQFTYSVTIYKFSPLFEELNDWFYANHSRKFKNIEIDVSYDEGLPHDGRVGKFSQKEGYFFIKYKGARFYINKYKIETKDSGRAGKPFLDAYTISSINKTKLFELITELQVLKKEEEGIRVWTNNRFGDKLLHQRLKPKKLSSVILDDHTKDLLVADISKFLDSEEWYEERGIPYTRGYMFHGAAGNGKTSLGLALASHFGKHIMSLDLASLDGDENLKDVYRHLDAGSILLIEDIDKAFNQRESSNENITFSCLLNCMNGVYSKHGVITIITTNHIERLDPALIRSGRIDMHVQVDNPKKEEVEAYVSMFYKDTCVLPSTYKADYCMADIQNICLQNHDNIKGAISQLKIKKNICK